MEKLGKIRTRIAGVVIALVLVAIPFIIDNPFYQDIAVTVFLFAGLGMAWNIIGGFAGQFSLGHAGFFGIGAYVSTLLYLHYGLSPWVGMVLGGGLASVISWMVFYPCFRLRGIFFAMSTMAFAQVLYILAVYWRGLTMGSVGLLIPFKPAWKELMFEDKALYALIAFGYMALSFGVSHYIKNSKLGSYLVGLRENEDAAESLGVDTTRCKLQAMMISAFLTALGGTFYAQYLQFIDPDSLFPSNISIRFALLAIIGGIGTVSGPMIGSFILTPLDVFLRGWLGGLYAGLGFFIYGCILIFVVLIRPQGIVKFLKDKLELLFIKRPQSRISSFTAEPAPRVQMRLPEGREAKQGKVILAVEGLKKNFGGLAAIKDVEFSITRGEILGLIGPNGAGKTTLFNLITGFITPDRGRIHFNGTDITGLRPPYRICKEGMSRTFQLVKPFLNISVLENVAVGAYCHVSSLSQANRRAEEVIEFVGLSRYRDFLSASLTLSNRKRLELARALATQPELLLLDETMAGLNPKEIDDMIELLRKISGQGITLFIIEHVMRAMMTLSDRVIVLHHGEKISEGSPLEISKDEKVIRAYLGASYVHANPA
jgi:branched-chain amino acid transport system permease protein